MIDARTAREKSIECENENRRKEIEKAIKRHIQNGRTEFKIMGSIPDDLKTELELNGYIVEEKESPQRMTFIKW